MLSIDPESPDLVEMVRKAGKFRLDIETAEEVPLPGLTGLRIEAIGPRRMNLLVRDLTGKSGPAVGATYNLLPYVPVKDRGRGIGTLMVLAADLHDNFMGTTHYSEDGFRGRLNAHAFQVEVAIRAGLEDVPDAVRAQYEIMDTGYCRLWTPWTMVDQNFLADEAAREQENEMDFELE